MMPLFSAFRSREAECIDLGACTDELGIGPGCFRCESDHPFRGLNRMSCTSYILCTKKTGLAQLGWNSRPEESGREKGKALAIRVPSTLWFFYPGVNCGDYVFLRKFPDKQRKRDENGREGVS